MVILPIWRWGIMHVLLSVILVSAAVWKGDWRQWQSYIHTIFYVITCNLLYNLLCKDYMLWEYQTDFIGGTHTIVELFYTFITLPAITLLFLSHYPYLKSKGRQFIFLLMWVAGSVLIEYPLYQLNRFISIMGMNFGWNCSFIRPCMG
ncbi:CBO0543 family protein [Bacillus sp. S3]|uniref:CBO0543 family protein n=1 Tax=Bacillus sp. S3 TaxID=486398 RepID=UPI00398A0A29